MAEYGVQMMTRAATKPQRSEVVLSAVVRLCTLAMLVIGVASGLMRPASAAPDPAFRAFLDAVRPEAEAAGVSRALFDQTTAGLEPDWSLPDLVIPGRATTTERGQAEFTQHPTDYLKRERLQSLAALGRQLALQHKATLERIEREIGVDRHGLLAIWGRETAFGTYKLPHDAIRVLATQAYAGRRKDQFRAELIAALKLIAGGIPRADLKASWAGAVGLTQFMPTEFAKHGVDFDSDGRVDLVRSVPDALASAAKQLKDKGWVLGQPWGYEVVVPVGSSCALEGPPGARKLSEWASLGFARPGGKLFRPADLGAEAYLMMPAGGFGPAFLALENFQVIRRYNTSDLYALFVGNLADRIGGGGDFETPWAAVAQPATKLVTDVQTRLQALGYPMDKIDGKIGSNTRRQIGAFETDAGLKPKCWPSPEVLRAAIAQPEPKTARP
jgi:lytic murein transglycosylase